jgi:hypothetical protein
MANERGASERQERRSRRNAKRRSDRKSPASTRTYESSNKDVVGQYRDVRIERGYQFLRINQRQSKPRTQGLTEIRGPYYTPMGPRYLRDVLETMGLYIDSVKFAGGSFTLMPRPALEEIIAIAHEFNVLVSTGGFIEQVLTQGPEAVKQYIRECDACGYEGECG